MKWLTPLLLGVVFSAQAEPGMCFTEAGNKYGIDPLLLMSYAIKESRLRADAVNDRNRNKTEDVCGMQINSSHYGKLKEFSIDRARLLKDPCICVFTGAWIAAHNFRAYGRNWDSVGMYNTGPKPKLVRQRREYAGDIQRIYRILAARRMLTERHAASDNSLAGQYPLFPEIWRTP